MHKRKEALYVWKQLSGISKCQINIARTNSLELGVFVIQPVASMVASSNESKSHDLLWFRFIDNLYFWKFPQTNVTDGVFPKWNRNSVNSENLINH